MRAQRTNKDGKVNIKVKFTEEEDKKLRRIIRQYGTRNWLKVSSLMKTRNPRQCRERWNNYLNPDLTNDPWTPEEDRLLEEKYAELGQSWNAISKFFVGRSDNSLRNRYMKLSRARRRMMRYERFNMAPDPQATGDSFFMVNSDDNGVNDKDEGEQDSNTGNDLQLNFDVADFYDLFRPVVTFADW